MLFTSQPAPPNASASVLFREQGNKTDTPSYLHSLHIFPVCPTTDSYWALFRSHFSDHMVATAKKSIRFTTDKFVNLNLTKMSDFRLSPRVGSEIAKPSQDQIEKRFVVFPPRVTRAQAPNPLCTMYRNTLSYEKCGPNVAGIFRDLYPLGSMPGKHTT